MDVRDLQGTGAEASQLVSASNAAVDWDDAFHQPTSAKARGRGSERRAMDNLDATCNFGKPAKWWEVSACVTLAQHGQQRLVIIKLALGVGG